ncbi:hypothetical protein IWX48DRAFT_325886 [Phyllosticta citricarpa]
MRFAILFLLVALLALIDARLVRASNSHGEPHILARAVEDPAKADKGGQNTGQDARKGGQNDRGSQGGQNDQNQRGQGNGGNQQGGEGGKQNGNGDTGNNDNGGGNQGGNGNQGTNGGGNAGDLQLQPDVIQKGSQSTGQDGTGSQAGQTPSETNDANFINFCEGDTLTNGAQNEAGSCNGIVMGKIPAQSQMVSAIIVSPKPGEDMDANKAFDIKVQTSNLKAGAFTNAQTTYYAAPQELDDSGDVVGHVHVVIQDMGGTMTPTNTLDASKFVFFKGIDDAGNGDGLLSATVADGLPPGVYRVCSMSSASNHQPVVMPVAQRGSQDDCTKFTVGQGKNANNGGGGNGRDGQKQNGQDKAQQDAQGWIGRGKINNRLVRSAKFIHPAFSAAEAR